MIYNAKDVKVFIGDYEVNSVELPVTGMVELNTFEKDNSLAGTTCDYLKGEVTFTMELLNLYTPTKTLKCRYKKGCRKGKVRFVKTRSISHDDFVGSMNYLRSLL